MTRNNRFSIITAAVMLAALTAWPSDVLAQRGGRPSGGRPGGGQTAGRPAGGQPATGRATPRPVYQNGIYRGSGYRGYYAPYYRGYYAPYYRGYSPYYWGVGSGWGWGVSLGWGYPYGYPYYSGYYPGYYSGYYQYPYYPRPYYQSWSDLRIEVTPRDAEVYLDGYLVGTVDDFDGTFQRLHVPYGEHQISIYFEGYRPIEQKMLFRPSQSYKIREVMQPVPAGEAPAPRPTPSAAPPDERGRPPMRGGDEPPMGERQAPPMRGGEPPVGERGARGDFGTLAVRVQPLDAEILVDGERWVTPIGDDRLTLELAEGTHHLEIRKEGRKPYSADVQIRRGRTSSLNVSLPPGN